VSPENRVLAGRYRVDDLIGEGGMARVYRGLDEKLGRAVAIKILRRELAADDTFRTRFRLEAQSASRMAHPSIVRVYDAGEDVETEGSRSYHTPYIVMELVEGTLLRDIIARGPVPVADAVRYVDGILEALEYSHRAGVVHRDIKPANVMVTDAGQVKVMDFGIARAASDSSSTVAETTQILGTAAYFSPEQAKGEPVDARADLYSTGVVLYELITGRAPFRGESPVAVAYQHVSETPKTPSEVNADAPRALDAVVLRALAKDPYQRYPDAASFRAALADAADGREPSKRAITALTNTLYGPNPRQAQETARTLRQLSTDTTMTRTQSGPPVAWIWAGVALLAVLLVSVVIWVLTLQSFGAVPANARIVPDVVGTSVEIAIADLEDEDLLPIQTTEPSDTVPEGVVIRTSPAAGESVTPNTEVEVVVSEGEAVSAVPGLLGMSESDARQAIERADLTVGIITSRNDPEAAAGTVLEATADEGEELPVGSTIDLVVATGRVAIDDYSGFRLDAATRAVEELGLIAEPMEDAECAAPSGDPQVSRQSPAPGDVDIHSTVQLYYCTGAATDGSGQEGSG